MELCWMSREVSGAGDKGSRLVQPELLDSLDPSKPEAKSSRKDLRFLNHTMGHLRMAQQAFCQLGPLNHIIEVGAGDATMMLAVVSRLPAASRPKAVTFVDTLATVEEPTRQSFLDLGVQATFVTSDVFDFFGSEASSRADLIFANLFLHHFDDESLKRLFTLSRNFTSRWLAFEPRRSRTNLGFTKLLWLLGCHPVTQHDARKSVQAGFSGHELSQLWGEGSGWALSEKRVGLFSHFFLAIK